MRFVYFLGFVVIAISLSRFSEKSVLSVFNTMVGFSGGSYGLDIPVMLLISPFLAFLYNPFVSLCSHTSNEVLTKTSTKLDSPMSLLAMFLSFRNGEMNEVMTITPASIISLATSAIRRMFSTRSSTEKPKSLFSPCLILSPSRIYVRIPSWLSLTSRALARVVLPDPESPVNQITFASCPDRVSLSFLVTVNCW